MRLRNFPDKAFPLANEWVRPVSALGDPMPELPEVETIARTLAPQVEGRRIVACELLNPSTFEGTIPLGKVVGGVIGRPGRRGKLLLLPLAFGSEPLPPVDEACPSGSLARCLACGDERITGLGFHLKMTGRLFVYPAGTPPEKHTRAPLRP